MMNEAMHELAGVDNKPKKEISEIHIKKVKGGHIVTHHHTHPSHYKSEEHVVPDMDGLHEHMEDHMGMENEGESEANAGEHGIPEDMLKDIGF